MLLIFGIVYPDVLSDNSCALFANLESSWILLTYVENPLVYFAFNIHQVNDYGVFILIMIAESDYLAIMSHTSVHWTQIHVTCQKFYHECWYLK